MNEQDGMNAGVQSGDAGATAEQQAITQIVFIDPRVADLQDLLNGLQPGVVAVVLDPTLDGLQQIADYLSANHLTGLAAIDIVGHGVAGRIDIGASGINDAALADHAAALSTIGASLAAGGDLALYACDVASGNAGHQFIADLSAYAGGVDVAASAHAIGGGADGGDFTLDSFAGPGVSQTPGPFTASAIADFQGLLAPAPTKAEVVVVGTGGGANNTLIFADDNGGAASPFQTTFFTPGSANYPAGISNNLELVSVDPLHNIFFLAVSNVNDHRIYSGTLQPDINNPTGTHALTLIYSDAASGLITGMAVDPTTQKLYFTEGTHFDSINYTGTGHVVEETGTDPLNGLTLDTTNHVAYFYTSTKSVTTNAASTAITTVFTDALLKDANYQSAGTGLTSMTLSGLPGVIAAIAITPDKAHLLLGTDSAKASDSGVFSYTIAGGAVSTVWSQKAGGVTGDIKGLTTDVNGDYYVTIADNKTSSLDGVYAGLVSDASKAPHLLLSMPNGATGLEPAGLTVDVPPDLTGVSGTATHAVQGGSAITVLTGTTTITDPDATAGEITSATVVIADGVTGDVLSATKGATKIAIAYNAATHTLTLTGADTFANYQTVLATVQYTDGANDLTPDGKNPTRELDFTVNDGLVDSPTSKVTIIDNRRPTAVNETAKDIENGNITGTAGTGGTGLLAKDHDLDGTAITVTAVSGSAGNVGASTTTTYGHLTANADGSYSYDADNTSAIDAAAKGSHPTDVITYTITNGEGLDATPNPTFTVTIDRAPTVVAENGAVVESATTTGAAGIAGTGALAGDSDPDADALSISAFSNLASGAGTLGAPLAGDYGDLTLNADGSYSYTANNTAAIDAAAPGSHPVDVFTIVVDDGNGLTTTTTLTFTVDRPPTTTDDTNSAVELGSAATGNVLTNDSDIDGDTVTVSALSGGTVGILLHGTYGDLTLNADGSYTYSAGATAGERTALAGAPGGGMVDDTYSYTADDGNGGTTGATLTITVDRLPTVAADTNTAVQGGGAATGNVLSNDSDKDGQGLTVSAISDTSNGSGTLGSPLSGLYGDLTLNKDGSYSYQIGATAGEQAALIAAGGGHQDDVFTYTASDGAGGFASTTLTITTDRNPVANPQTGTVVEGGTVKATGGTLGTGAIAGDTDPDGDGVNITAYSSKAGGAGTLSLPLAGDYGHLTLNSDGSYSYVADITAAIDAAPPGSRPVDVFNFTIDDANGGTSSTTLTFTVDRPPVGVDDKYQAIKDTLLTVPAGTGVLANDSDPDGDSISASPITGPAHALTFALQADGSFTYQAQAGYTGPDSFTYEANDGTGNSALVTVTLDVINAVPTPAPDTADVVELQTVSANAATGLLSNDTDPNNETLTVTGVKDATNGPGTVGTALSGQYGDLTVQSDGSYSYTAGANPTEINNLAAAAGGSHVTDVFTYRVTNSPDGYSADSTLTVTLDRLPNPGADFNIAQQNGGTPTGNVLTNDSDIDGDTLTVSALSGGTLGVALSGKYGDLTLNADGTYAYAVGATVGEKAALIAAPAGSHATDTFTYTVDDGQGGTASTTLTITLDRLPTTSADTNTAVQAGSAASGNVLTNNSDVDGDTLTVSGVFGGTVGTTFSGTYGDITVNADGSYTYKAGATPTELTNLAGATAGSHPTEVITYIADDGFGGTTTNTLTITVDRLPTTSADTNTAVSAGPAASGNVLTNDSDLDGDTLTVSAVAGGTVGTTFSGKFGDITVNADGSYTYAAGATPTELTNLAGAPAGSHPTETVTYTASDGKGGTTTNTLTITVDRLPSATADTNSAVQSGAAATGNVLTNDSDIDGDTLTVSAIAGGTVGSVLHGKYGDLTLNANGTYSYSAGATAGELTALAAAAGGSHPTESFTYTESDGKGGTAQTTLTITLDRLPSTSADTNTAVSAGPAATGNVLTNDSDPDGDTLTVSAVAGGTVGTKFSGTYGEITVNADGSYTYFAGATPTELTNLSGAPVGSHPTEVVTYTASDGKGGTTTNTLTITVDRLPSATADTNSAVQSGPAATGNVLTNDSDVDGDTLTVSAIAGGTVGSVLHGKYGDLTLNANGTYSYSAGATAGELTALAAAAGGSHPTESFTYTESDGKGGTASTTLTFTLDRLPAATADTNAAVQSGPAATGNVLTNDSDIDGDTLTVSAVAGGTVGSVLHGKYGDLTLNADGTYSYAAGATAGELAALAAAPAGSHPTEAFTYTESDGKGGTAQTTLTLTLDRLPTAVNDKNTSGVGLPPATGNVLTNDSDIDGDTLTVTAVAGGVIGSSFHGKFGDLTLNANGTYSYTAGATPTELAAIAAVPVGTAATEVFTYTDSDGKGGTSQATLTIVLNQPPTANPDVNAVVQGATASGNVLVNDTDPDHDPLTVTSVTPGTLGTLFHGTYGDLTLNANGAYTYAAAATPAELAALLAASAGSHPTEQFTYKISDGKGGTSQSTLTITLDRLPVAATDANAAVQSGPAVTGNVLTNDTDKDGDTLSITAVGPYPGAVGITWGGKYGNVLVNADGSYTYTVGATAAEQAALAAAPAGSHPTETISYTESDGHGGTATSSLTITLDRLPTGVAESAELLSGATVNRTAGTGGTGALAGDSDKDGDGLTITALTGGTLGVAKAGAFGTLTLNADGSYSYVASNSGAINGAPLGSHPTDVFNYTISDGHGGTIPETLSLIIDRPPTITGAVAGQSDDDQHTISPFASVTITEPDDASKIETVKVVLDSAAKGTITAASLAASGFTKNGVIPGEYDFTGTAAKATAAIHQLVFSPTPNHVAPGLTETTTFTISVNDGVSPTVSNSLTTVNTLSINDAPVALAQKAFVEEMHVVTGNVLTGDYDVDVGDSVHLTGIAVGAGSPTAIGGRGAVLVGNYGILTIQQNGNYSYSEFADVLKAGDTHTDTFTYKITDTHSASTTNTLTFTITSDDADLPGGGGGGGGGHGPPSTVMGGSNGHYLVGGAGPVSFQYNSVTDSTVANPDLIANFNPEKGDIIDLTHLDAIPGTPAQDHFSLVSSFSHHAGELVLQAPDATGYWHIYGDVNGDGVADFAIAFHLIGHMDNGHLLL